MKNIIIAVVVLILVVLGVVFLTGNDSAQAPVVEPGSETTASPTPSTGVSVDVSVVGEYQAPVKEFTVTAKNFAFTPSTITVNKGDRVKITFVNSEGFHDFKIDAFGFATKQAQAPNTEVLEFTADKSGTFEYYCSVGSHRAMGMKGKLVVN